MESGIYVTYSSQSSLRVEGIVTSFQEKEIGAAFEEGFRLLPIRINHFIERNGTLGWLAHLGRKRQGFRRWTHRTGHKYPAFRSIRHLSGNEGTFASHFSRDFRATVFLLTDSVG